jgi:hypothetical protein
MVTVQRAVTAAAGVLAPGHLGELTGWIPFELVDDVLEQTMTVQRRTRVLPSRVGVYFVLALAMWPRLGYLRVWGKLTAALEPLGLRVPSEKALRDLRMRLGEAPLRLLFEAIAGPAALPGTPGVRYRHWRTVAFDGCTSVRAPDRPRILDWLGKIRYVQGEAAYPALRIMALCETGTQALIGAAIGTLAGGETALASQLLHLLDGSMLLLDDRGFDSGEFIAAAAATGAQLLVRLNAGRAPARWAVLDDGTYLTVISGVRLRVIEARVTADTRSGARTGDRYLLATTLLDPRRHRAAGLVSLYHERQEIELAFFSLRHTLGQGLVMRSQDPVSLRQETWAQLALYQALRRAMTDAAESAPGTDPDRASFTIALETAREQVTAAAGIAPADPRPGQGRIAARVLAALLPPRRPRTAPRKVKSPTSRYSGWSGQARPDAAGRITAVTVAIMPAAAAGRRNLLLQLMRTSPHRAWRAREIAAGLGLTASRAISAELRRWSEEGILTRPAPGIYALHPDWTGPGDPAGHALFDIEPSALTTRY